MGGKQHLYRSIVHNKITNFANIFINTIKPNLQPARTMLDGCFAIHKPPGITSAQVIRDVQAHFLPSTLFKPMLAAELASRESHQSQDPRAKKKRSRRERRPLSVKMGHGGTLDPGATGVLVLGVGGGTKSLPQFIECTKSYETVLLLGAATDTYDVWGKIVARKQYEHVTREAVEQAMNKFRGKIMQKPPIFSALRVQGKRLYEYAREGKEVPVEIKERPVEVLELELLEWMEGGTHEWQWPTTEAPQEEQKFAQDILDLSEAGNQEKGAAGLPSEVVDRTTDQGTARSEEHLPLSSDAMMSGGLPDSSSSELAAEQANESNMKRKREDEIANVETDDPSSKRHKSPAPSSVDASSASSRIIATPATLSNPLSGDSAQADSTPMPSKTTRPPCPAPAMRIRMTVTSGFYVRSLCQDLGVAVGSLGVMASLVRSRQGDFSVGSNVLAYEDLAKGEDVWAPKVEQMLEDWQSKQQQARQDESRDRDVNKDGIKLSIERGGAKQGNNADRRPNAYKRRNTSSTVSDG